MNSYCIYSDVLKMYWNFNKNQFTNISNGCFESFNVVEKKVNDINREVNPEIHILSTKPVQQYEEVSVY